MSDQNTQPNADQSSTKEFVDTQLALASQGKPSSDNIDYLELYRQEKRRADDLQQVITASKLQPTQAAPGANIKVKTFEQSRAQVGAERWHRMSEAERFVAMGQDPNQDRQFIRQVWGKGADPSISADLFKSNPVRYRQTREAALALGIFGAK